MNDRIKELALQSGAIPLVGHDGLIISNLNVEKFAELLIKECTTKMALEIMNNSWVDDAVKSTYQHFGLDQ